MTRKQTKSHVDFHHSVDWPSISISRFSEPIVRDAAETDDPRDLTYALEDTEADQPQAETQTPQTNVETTQPTFEHPAVDLNDPILNDLISIDPISEPPLFPISNSQTKPTDTNATPITRSDISTDNILSRSKTSAHRALARVGQNYNFNDIPKRFRDVADHTDANLWKAAMKKEHDGLMVRNYGTFVHPTEARGHIIIPTRWVFTVKSSGDQKARQVVMGNLQSDDDAPFTYAPTPTSASFKVFLFRLQPTKESTSMSTKHSYKPILMA